MASDKFAKYLTKRILKIQKKYNFNPNVGAKQIKNRQSLIAPYAVFVELRKLAKFLKLDISIPYDSGNFPVKIVSKKQFVYFAEAQGSNKSIWKIGYSFKPGERIYDLQTGNHLTLLLRHKVEGGRKLEAKFHHYYRKSKTRDRSRPNKGEWFELDRAQVKADIKLYLQLKEEFFAHGLTPTE